MKSRLLSLLLCLLFGPAQSQQKPFAPLLGVCTSIDNHAAVTAAGFDYIEESVQRFLIPDKGDEEFKANLKKLTESAIPVLACNGFIPGRLKSTGPETHHTQILQYAETAFQRARLAGIRIIVFGSSGSRNYPEGFSHEKAMEQFTTLLTHMAPLAEAHGVVVVIEPLRKEESNLINRLDEALELVIRVNHPHIRALGDVFHMTSENEEPQSFIEARRYLHHTHIAEKDQRTAPGLQGDNFMPYLAALRDAGYEGGISIEGRWGEDFEKNLVIARAYLDGQIQALQSYR